MSVLRAREQRIFLVLADAVVAPADGLPAVADTDALRALDAHLRAAPRVNRLAFRAMLRAVDLLPRATGPRVRLRELDRPGCTAALERLRRHSASAPIVKALQATAHMTYYGDDRVMRRLGYDADAVVARAAVARTGGTPC